MLTGAERSVGFRIPFTFDFVTRQRAFYGIIFSLGVSVDRRLIQGVFLWFSRDAVCDWNRFSFSYIYMYMLLFSTFISRN